MKIIRCPSCKGLRGISARHHGRGSSICLDCRKGRVIPRSQFHNYWTRRFTMEEIQELAKAIWG